MRVTVHTRGGLAAGLAAAVAVTGLLAGCATNGTPYHTPASASASARPAGGATAPTVPAGPLPSMPPLAAARGQLTGTQLAQVLLPASFFPAGFTTSSAPVTSSGSLAAGQATYNLATVDCATFVYHLGRTGFGETALAADSAVGTGQVYSQVVYQFGSASAATAFVSGARAVAARCGKPFTANEGTASGTFTLAASTGLPVGGQPSVELAQTGRLGGQSLILDTLLVPSGVDVFIAAAVGIGGGAPAVPARETLVYNLMKRQAAVAVLS